IPTKSRSSIYDTSSKSVRRIGATVKRHTIVRSPQQTDRSLLRLHKRNLALVLRLVFRRIPSLSTSFQSRFGRNSINTRQKGICLLLNGKLNLDRVSPWLWRGFAGFVPPSRRVELREGMSIFKL